MIRGYRYSSLMQAEIREPASLAIALIALVIAVGRGNIFNPFFYMSGYFVGILVGFIGHELAHRQVARKYGLYAEFIAWPPGLIATVGSVLLPLIIIAPGYVKTVTYGYYNPKGVLNSVAAGPAVNIVLAAAGYILFLFTGNPWLLQFADINGLIAVFNLIPFPPLDGEKIMRYNQQLWIGMFLVAAALHIAT